jgi:enoyl-CoA hydratase/carnithine racemase
MESVQASPSNSAITEKTVGKVRCLIFNHPPSNNLSLSFFDHLETALKAAEEDSGVRAVLLSSAIPKYFSAGLELSELFSSEEKTRTRLFLRLIDLHKKLAHFPKPTLAAIEGSAFLGGFVLALGCDFRLIAEETGRVSLSEVRLGLSPTLPLISLVASMSGRPGLIKDLILKGKTLRAGEALEAGLVDHIFPNSNFFETSIKEAEKLSKLPPMAYRAIKTSLRSVLMKDEEKLWEKGLVEFNSLFAGEEAQEGVRAMFEKRKPRWE